MLIHSETEVEKFMEKIEASEQIENTNNDDPINCVENMKLNYRKSKEIEDFLNNLHIVFSNHVEYPTFDSLEDVLDKANQQFSQLHACMETVDVHQIMKYFEIHPSMCFLNAGQFQILIHSEDFTSNELIVPFYLAKVDGKQGLKITLKENLVNLFKEKIHSLISEGKKIEIINSIIQKNTPIENIFENLFEKPIEFNPLSLKCFGTSSLTATFIGKWNEEEVFFKIAARNNRSEFIFDYLVENGPQLKNSHPNLSNVKYFKKITNLESVRLFLELAKHNSTLNDTNKLRYYQVDMIVITVQEKLDQLFPFLREIEVNDKVSVVEKLLRECIQILNQLDSLDIIHKDISIDNVMVRHEQKYGFRIVLVDFDFSEMTTDLDKQRPRKLSRESYIVRKFPYFCRENSTTVGDIYSMGIVLLEMVHVIGKCFPIPCTVDDQDDEKFKQMVVEYLKVFEKQFFYFSVCFYSFRGLVEFRNLILYMVEYEKLPTLTELNKIIEKKELSSVLPLFLDFTISETLLIRLLSIIVDNYDQLDESQKKSLKFEDYISFSNNKIELDFSQNPQYQSIVQEIEKEGKKSTNWFYSKRHNQVQYKIDGDFCVFLQEIAKEHQCETTYLSQKIFPLMKALPESFVFPLNKFGKDTILYFIGRLFYWEHKTLKNTDYNDEIACDLFEMVLYMMKRWKDRKFQDLSNLDFCGVCNQVYKTVILKGSFVKSELDEGRYIYNLELTNPIDMQTPTGIATFYHFISGMMQKSSAFIIQNGMNSKKKKTRGTKC